MVPVFAGGWLLGGYDGPSWLMDGCVRKFGLRGRDGRGGGDGRDGRGGRDGRDKEMGGMTG